MTDATRVAVLIDCDDISWQPGAAVLAEAAGKGTLGLKRGYGDLSNQALSGWRELPVLAIQPMQQPAYVVGKNATDSELIIDARVTASPSRRSSCGLRRRRPVESTPGAPSLPSRCRRR